MLSAKAMVTEFETIMPDMFEPGVGPCDTAARLGLGDNCDEHFPYMERIMQTLMEMGFPPQVAVIVMAGVMAGMLSAQKVHAAEEDARDLLDDDEAIAKSLRELGL